ncbi:MAG TPA: SDR family oxidoreductase [Gemmatimonas sp.]|uniref:SDR family oxidoreductase n=1 Tax=Gemmatimonas sp. TaxID=1962908 RepID=UPI002ED9018F
MTDALTAVFRPGLLNGQVALVTGGGTGIGLGISELLAELGAHVVIASRKADNVQRAVQGIVAKGQSASAVTLDVRNADQVKEVVQGIAAQHGRLDVLVNNAAGNFYAPSATLSPNAWKSVVEIDLYGTFHCSQAVYPIMAQQGGGRIISTSMTLHYRGWPLMAHATAAKAGVDALTRTLAVEWAPERIRVNAIAPGPIPTEGVKKAFTPPADSGVPDLFAAAEEKMAEYARTGIPLGRWGMPRDIANMVAFLASPAGDWITGAIFVVDGGEWLSKGGRQGAP